MATTNTNIEEMARKVYNIIDLDINGTLKTMLKDSFALLEVLPQEESVKYQSEDIFILGRNLGYDIAEMNVYELHRFLSEANNEAIEQLNGLINDMRGMDGMWRCEVSPYIYNGVKYCGFSLNYSLGLTQKDLKEYKMMMSIFK